MELVHDAFPADMQVINLTRHDIVLYNEDGTKTKFKPSGYVCRVVQRSLRASSIGAIPLKLLDRRFGTVVNLPPRKENTVYLVSAMVLDCLLRSGVYRPDVFAPATGRAQGVIQENGFIRGVKYFLGIDYGVQERPYCRASEN